MKLTKPLAELDADQTVFKLDMLRLDIAPPPNHLRQPGDRKGISAASKQTSFRDVPASFGSQNVPDTRQEEKGVAADGSNSSNRWLS
jgi:hypothetical protein